MRVLSNFVGCRRGNIAIAFACLAPLLLAGVGAGVDYARYVALRAEFQEVADTAALAGARQFLIKKDDVAIAEAIALDVAEDRAQDIGPNGGAEIEAVAQGSDASVTVGMSYALKPSFLVSIFKNPLDINVSSTAVAGGSENICVIGLNDSSSSTVRAQNFATLNGPRCAVYSNSTSTSGMNSSNSAQIKSVLTCTSGGYSGSSVNYDPMPQTDCPKRTDPLAERTPPSVGGCDQSQVVKTNFVGTLLPGVYCGGLTIDGASRVDFADGVYVMKDGHLTISGKSIITGDNVGFFFSGTSGGMTISGSADIDLSAPTSGPMAGILVWQDKNVSGTKVFLVMSGSVRKMVGTIYLPKGVFRGASNGAIADQSAYTAIIADKVELSQQANLVLNTNYFQTNVPVPGGLRGERVFLRQ